MKPNDRYIRGLPYDKEQVILATVIRELLQTEALLKSQLPQNSYAR
jgi:flagellar motor switch protein FliG